MKNNSLYLYQKYYGFTWNPVLSIENYDISWKVKELHEIM